MTKADDLDVEVGRRLRHHRKSIGMSQSTLAERMTAEGAGASQTMVAKWELANTPMRFREAIVACRVLEIPTTALADEYAVPPRDQTVAALRLAKSEMEKTLDGLIQSRLV